MPKVGEAAVGTLPDNLTQTFADWKANVDAKIADHDDRVADNTIPVASLESAAATGASELTLSNLAETHDLTVTWNGSADQNFKFPTANPVSTKLMQLTSTGQAEASISASDPSFTSVTATTVTPTTIAGTPNFTGAVTMASTLVATGNVTGARVRSTAAAWRTVYITSANLIASNTFTNTAGTYTHTSGGSSSLTTSFYTMDANTDWFFVDITPILEDGEIITDWRIPLQKTSGSGGSSIRGGICVSDTAGVVAVPGSLSETVAVAAITNNEAGAVEYSGSSTVTVDFDGALTSDDWSRNYFFMGEMTTRGTGDAFQVRCVQIKVKQA